MVKAEPDAPAIMIENYREQERCSEENLDNQLVIEAEHRQAEDVKSYNHEVRCDYIDQNRSDEKARLAHKQRIARRAMMLDLERPLND